MTTIQLLSLDNPDRHVRKSCKKKQSSWFNAYDSCGKMSSKHTKEVTAKMPAHLLQSLRAANITDKDEKSIEKKLQERTVSSILSYMQLSLIKLTSKTVAARDFSNQMQAQTERASFGQVLADRVRALRNV